MATRKMKKDQRLGRLLRLERQVMILEGIVKNLESSYNDSRMNAGELSRERYELAGKVDSYIKGGFAALTKVFLTEIRADRLRMAEAISEVGRRYERDEE